MYAPSRRGRDGSIVVGVGGISGSGKSTIARALAEKAREYGYSSYCISMDDFFNTGSLAPLPAATLSALASSAVDCIREKKYDTNSPAAINWPRFLSEIAQRRTGPGAPDFLFVEGFLAFCKDGSRDLACGTSVFDAAVFVSVSKHVAMERKRARSYPSVKPEDFALYFDTVTYPNYRQYGCVRPANVPIFPYRNDCEVLDSGGVDALLRSLLPVVVCVGDLHGWLDRTTSLFDNLRTSLPEHQFNTADVVFLGDYVDRGPQSRETIEWLVSSLPLACPRQRHFFLAGNHELALMAALGDLQPPEGGFVAWGGRGEEAVWDGPGSENVHWQGRRYLSVGRCDVYNAGSTMASYGIDCLDVARAFGDGAAAVLQHALQRNVPTSHREFLKDCDWVIEFPARGSWLPQLTFVHAGFALTDANNSLETQLARLRAKDCRETRIPQLSGRAEVLEPPPEIMAGNGMLVSGHHGFMQVRPHRAIIDESGGCVGQPLAAMILPFSAHAHVASAGGMMRDLQLMGFHPAACAHALQVANYSQERAVNWLLSHDAEAESLAVAMSSAVTFLQPARPVYVYSGQFFEGLSMFWNLDAMWQAAYSRARNDGSIDIVLHVKELAHACKISKQDMARWVNRQTVSSGYTLLHQVAWHKLYDRHKNTFLEMGADESITTLRRETAQDILARKLAPK